MPRPDYFTEERIAFAELAERNDPALLAAHAELLECCSDPFGYSARRARPSAVVTVER